MSGALSSWSSALSMSKPRPSQPKPKSSHPPTPAQPAPTMSHDSLASSRASSLAGRKRPRESDGDAKARLSRRTKSVGDTRDGRRSKDAKDKDREAFQRSLIGVFVPNALRESLTGRMENYNDLLAHFLPSPLGPPPSLPGLLPILRAVTAHVSLLMPENHATLVSAILGLPWAAGDDKFVKVFIGFCGVLVSAQPGWAKEVVDMGVRGLRWQPIMPSITKPPISRRNYHARHHLLLAHLLSLIPTLPSVIQPLLAKHFPNKREAEVAQTTWVRNCCELIGYCPELGQRVWSQIVDRLLRIDAEITKEEEEDEDDDDEEEEDEDETEDEAEGTWSRHTTPTLADPFEISITQDIPKPASEAKADEEDDDESDPDVDELSSVDGDDGSDREVEVDEEKLAIEKLKRRAAVKSMKEKLDGMLLYFFRHLEECMGARMPMTPAAEMAAFNLSSTATSSGASTPTAEFSNSITSALPHLSMSRPPSTPAQSLSHFQTLLTLFTRQILPTSSTQHIPFLLFFTSSLTSSHTELFLGLLVSQALYGSSTAQPSPTSAPLSLAQRISSTVYIGSVVCRAKHVTDVQARQVMVYLLAYIDGKMHQTPKPDDPPLFYAVCQATMLIFCFRWRALLSSGGEGDSVIGEMELEEGSVEGEGEGDGKWMKDLDVLQRVLTSDLNPLLGCNPTIVATFAKVAHQTNFAYCFSIIEANLAHSRPTSAPTQPGVKSRNNSLSYTAALNTARNARQSNIDSGLDDYFPFDPYDLPRSKRYVAHLYRQWSEVAIGADDSDEEEESEDEGEEEDEDEDVERSETGSLADSVLEDRLAARKISVPKGSGNGSWNGNGSWTDKRKRMFEKDNGLSSSLEGMSISPSISRLVRP